MLPLPVTAKKWLRICCVLWIPINSWAVSYSEIYVFGDSLSDTGNLSAITAGLFPPPPYFEGRISNGPLWVEYLATYLDLPYNQDANFAWAGAHSGTKNSFGPLPGLATQVEWYVNTQVADPNALYIVWAGGNDLFSSLDTPETAVDTIAANLISAITRLFTHGARKLLVANIPNLGLTPRGQATSAELTKLSRTLNETLAAHLEQLDFPVAYIDMFNLIQDAWTYPQRFGFTNVTDPCFILDSLQLCDSPDTYLFWDEEHPTTMAHKQMGDLFFLAVTGSYYDMSQSMLHLHAVDVSDTLGETDVFTAKMRYVSDDDTISFVLVDSQIINANSRLVEHATFDKSTGQLYIPDVAVSLKNYEAVLTYTLTEYLSGSIVFTLTELTEK